MAQLQAVKQVQAQVPIYASRAMRKKFADLLGKGGLTVSRSVSSTLYSMVTGYKVVNERDQDRFVRPPRFGLLTESPKSTARCDRGILNIIAEAIHADRPDLIQDMREYNGSKGKRFEAFWDVASGVIDSDLSPGADDRRHGVVRDVLVMLCA
jgi:hypothetical protein